MNYIKDPKKIETHSMSIIEGTLGDVSFGGDELPIVKRMIHTTGDVDYRHIIRFQDDFVEKATEAISKGVRIYTDTQMANVGVNRPALEKTGCSLVTYISSEVVRTRAVKEGTTRSAVAIDVAIDEGVEAYVLGNAPTALFRLLERIASGDINPAFVVGVPVGFVGAAESKEALRQWGGVLPRISTEGPKGGSNVACSVINALLYSVGGRDW